ncbi:carbohydrate ABC transporter permease [Microbacterium aquimaris]|uniref:Sugar ABC transporter permease n=1 Tax=Microbacterium aquimaris TaxID=459816 RepID=A0ABU5N2P4_9MICO|nr:sugar ABC transporter permease [Microbacterium aquimaris]MDZ8160360.1 sugar ABC transporter permease [Microbacterium aquimaris]
MAQTAATVTASPPPAGGSGPVRRRDRRQWLFWLAVAPALLIFGVFSLYPVAQVIYYSFTDYNGFTSGAEFIGLQNYLRAFTDEDLHEAIWHTVVYAFFYIIVQLIVAFLIAVLLGGRLLAGNLYRSIFFVPFIISPVAVVFAWSFMLDPNTGTINTMLRSVGLDFLAQDWLGNYDLALFAVIAIDLWRNLGFSIVIFLAGLGTIPEEVVEAARIDGASPWQTLMHITVPMMKPTIGLATVLAINGALRAFDTVFLLTQGGPGGQTELYMTRTFAEAFSYNQFGYAAALTVFVLVALIIIAGLQNRMNTSQSGSGK